LADQYEEMYVSYDVMFMPGFQFQSGGKLPGVKGGAINITRPNGYDGFSAYMMFKVDRPAFYIYYPDANIPEYGVTFEWGREYNTSDFSPSQVQFEYTDGSVHFSTGEWHNITYRVVLNTINSDQGNYDGILEAYYDGKLVTQVSHVLFRHTSELKINQLVMMSFFGGASDNWRNPIYEWLKIDNVMLYTFKDNLNIPRGNNLSPTNRTINYWRKIITDNLVKPANPSNPYGSNITKNSATIRWTDNSNNEYGFDIYQSTSATGNFSKIGSTPANTTEFTNPSLTPNTTYYYKILAFNGSKTSDFTSTLTLTTKALQIPIAPSSLKSMNPTISNIPIEWFDNSNNETGFEIEKSEGLLIADRLREVWKDYGRANSTLKTAMDKVKENYRERTEKVAGILNLK
jgi:hypothetical protein